MKINFYNETNENVEEFKKLINRILAKNSKFKKMNIIFVTSVKILEINKQYRKKDYVTDVISFPNGKKELGDIFICIDKARIQAKAYHHSIDREIGFLATHGYLHLLGYDHLTEEDEKIMIKKQKEILTKAKLERVTK